MNQTTQAVGTETAVIAFRIFDRELFDAHAVCHGAMDAHTLVEAMLTGKPPVECGYELVKIQEPQ